VLGRSLDELAPPTRTFLVALHGMVETWAKEKNVHRDKVRFSRREVRERLKWSEPQVRRHLDRLTQLEYLLCHRVPGSAARFLYELVYDGEGQTGGRFMIGLTPESSLKTGQSS